LVSAITFSAVSRSEWVVVEIWTVTPVGPLVALFASSDPSAKLVSTVAIAALGPPSVPLMTSVRPGWPSLKTTTGCAGGGGVVDLLAEGAGAALNQCDLAGDVEAVEVGGLTARRRAGLRRRRDRQVDRHELGRDLATAGELGRREVLALLEHGRIGRDPLEHRRRVLKEGVEVKRLAGHLPSPFAVVAIWLVRWLEQDPQGADLRRHPRPVGGAPDDRRRQRREPRRRLARLRRIG
jgi:hypothetical protein